MLTANTSSCLCSAFCLALLPRWSISRRQGLVSAVCGSVSIASTSPQGFTHNSHWREVTWDGFKCCPSLPNFLLAALNNIKLKTETVYVQHWEFPHWNLNIKIWTPVKLRHRQAAVMWTLFTPRQDHTHIQHLPAIVVLKLGNEVVMLKRRHCTSNLI